MSLRGWINERPAMAACIALVGLALALGVVYLMRRSTPPARAWYLDTGTGELFVAGQEWPETGPSGGHAARAYVLGCGGCGRDQLKIAYVEAMTPEARMAAGELSTEHTTIDGEPIAIGGAEARLRTLGEGHFIADAKNPKELAWVSAMSREGQALRSRVESITCPDGQAARICPP